MKKKEESFFWMSFSDLMTSLFFIMLVLYVLTYIMLKKKEKELVNTVEDLKHKLEVYDLVEQNLKPLKADTNLFRYEEKFKRFTLAFDVKFKVGQEILTVSTLDTKDPAETINRINEVGKSLKRLVDNLYKRKLENPNLEDVSYIIIISGYASNLKESNEFKEYQRSYNRAWNLWNHWKSRGIDFEDKKYEGIVDLQISGNGLGGVGRFERDEYSDFRNEVKNQRFIIQIVPKLGNTNS